MTIWKAALLVPFLSACGSSGDPGQDPGAVDGSPHLGDSGSSGDGDGDGDDGVEENTSGSRIKARVAATPDGAKAVVGWHDTLLGIDCYFHQGVQRCIPLTFASFSNFYSDAACTVRLAFSGYSNCEGEDPKYAAEFDSACSNGTFYTYYETTPATPDEVYTLSGTDCTTTPVNDSYTYYTVGAEVPLNTFQSATISLE